MDAENVSKIDNMKTLLSEFNVSENWKGEKWRTKSISIYIEGTI